MRILHISSEKSWRGGEQQIAYLIKGAPEQQHYVFCRQGSAFEKYCEQNEIPFQSASFHPLYWAASALKLKRYARDKSIDIVHLHTGKAHLLGYLAILSGMKQPAVASRRVAVPPSRSLLTKRRYDHPGIKRIICISEEIRKVMTSYLSHPEKAVTIYSGIDPDRFSKPGFDIRERYSISSDTFIIGTVSAMSPEKDLETFVRVADSLIKENFPVKFFIVGDGALRSELEQQIASLHLGEYIFLTGHVSDPGAYLQQFDLFLFTSRLEGLGTSVLDAFACQVPVVASSVGGIPEIVLNQKTGMTIESGNVAEFKSAVVRILEDPERARTYVTQASEHLNQFTYQRMAAETIGCYSSVLVNEKN
jgi:glycosyltransferase involved in cell wall biosynthesis